MNRRGYLDWLRGVAVLIMIEAHILDAWTRVDARGDVAYRWAIAIGGFGAPIFLFLAGIAMALAAGSRLRSNAGAAAAAARARARGWQVLGLAFLFRLQSWIISGGDPSRTLLKVDILNIMGMAMLLTAVLWGAGRGGRSRAFLLASGAVAVAMATPIVHALSILDGLPDPIEWYFRPGAGITTFAVFPWAGFLLAGGAAGIWLDSARSGDDERRTIARLALVGPAVALAGYGASFLPAIYDETSFWTSSPTFFFLRLGVLMTAIPVAYVWNRWPGRSPVREFGVASLFVYWIHVEMVYGIVAMPLHRQLTVWQSAAGFGLFTLLMFRLVKLRDRLVTTKVAKDAESQVTVSI